MNQLHLEYSDRVNLGSYYTPIKIVDLAWKLLSPYITSDHTIIDTACGYGDFLLNCYNNRLIGYDIDSVALDFARKNKENICFINRNSLLNVSRKSFGIDSEVNNLIIVGNPPYNDKTSIIRNGVKKVVFEVDDDLRSRDLGISFLRSYAKLGADLVCVLHPLSYLIKRSNFNQLKDFASSYKLKNGLIISSSEFKENSKVTSFPIIIGLYERKFFGMDYGYISDFKFSVLDGKSFCISDMDDITNYIDKYPRVNNLPIEDDMLFFWTMRDINALKRNRTFVKSYSSNTIIIDNSKLDYYVYVDVFKRNIYRLPFYFGNCDIPIDNGLFNEYKSYFISDSILNNPELEKYYDVYITDVDKINLGLDKYFKILLEHHHV